MPVPRHLLVATDLSEASDAAVDAAVELATACGAELTLLHVCELPSFAYAIGVEASLVEVIEDAARKRFGEALTSLSERFARANGLLRSGTAWREILAVADELRADVIVVGAHGRGALARLVLGSVAEKVVRNALVPVLTVRGAPPA